MAEKEIARVEIRDWSGLVTHADRQDISPGSGRIQVNMQSDSPRQIRVRRGLTRVQFDSRGLIETLELIAVREDVTTFLLFVFRETSDAIVITENVSIAFATVPPSEAVLVAESLSVTQVFTASASDIVFVSESIGRSLTVIPSAISDGISVSDALVATQVLLVTTSMTVSVSENVSAALGKTTFWTGYSTEKLYLTSGQFTSTLRTSVLVNFPANNSGGISWDGTNTPWARSSGGDISVAYSKLYLQSGSFSSTTKTSLNVSSVDQEVRGISWDSPHTPWVGIVSSAAFDCKLYRQSGQFTSTLKTSRDVTAVDNFPNGISWDGTNTPWTGFEASKLYLQSGHFASTLKTSRAVGTIDIYPNGVSWDNVNTSWSGYEAYKLYLQSGQFASTLKTSQYVGSTGDVIGIETNLVKLRIS